MILLAILAWIGFGLSASAQPALPKPLVFEWDAPTNMAGIIGWKFQFGDLTMVDLPIYQALYQVDDAPLMLHAPVSVYSSSSSTNSEPTTIYVFNVLAHLEESGDGVSWTVAQTTQWSGEKSSNTMFRVRLETNK